MFFKIIKSISLVVIGILFFAVMPAQAQDSDWRVSTVVYLWGAGLDGEVGVGQRTAEIDQSFGDILSNLELGFMGGVRARNDTWSVTGDVMWIALGTTLEGPLGNRVAVDVDQLIVSGDVGYALGESAEVMGGVRIVTLQNKLDFQGPLNIQVEAEKTWVDPYVGLRFTPRFSESWSLLTRFDIGGFDIGSDLTWQLTATPIWHVSEKASLAFGYRVLSMNYDDEEGDNLFLYDAKTHGPITALIYEF